MVAITRESRRFADYVITKADVEACQERFSKLASEGDGDAAYMIAMLEEDSWFELVFVEQAEAAGDQETLEEYAKWISAEHDIMSCR